MLKLVRFALYLAAGISVMRAAHLETSYQNLKAAVERNDAARVKTLAAETLALAREEIAAPKGDQEEDAWQKSVEYARGIESYTEYALYATAIQAPPETTVDLLATLEQQNPKSKYLDQGYGAYFYALHKTGAAAKVPAAAEKALENFPENDDALLVLAEAAYAKQQNDRALGYATRLTAALNKHAKPEGVSAADWERKRNAGLASSYWIAGVVQASKNQFFEADKDLRVALPLVAGNETRKAYALFYLGMANYNLGKMTMKKARVLEAAKFSQEAAAIKGPLAQQAWHNAQVMKDEAAKMR